jgi:lipopolysaccharide export system protein LptA
MKRIIQLILLSIIIITSLIFYKVYFGENTKNQKQVVNLDSNSIEQTENNLIKNLKYEVKLGKGIQYIITSDLSEISYEGNIEFVKMQKVIAIYLDITNIPIVVTSDTALYNAVSYDTKFKDNVRIEYLDNIILSDQMNLDFGENLITIFDNVVYNGGEGTIKSDIVKIDLITKQINIYMNSDKKNVEVIKK